MALGPFGNRGWRVSRIDYEGYRKRLRSFHGRIDRRRSLRKRFRH